jgi:tetratricopeptide (TPR) repeat protein
MLTSQSTTALPQAPADQAALPVAAWESAVTIDTYLPEEPDRYPAYLDSRVYQGSSGRVYPLPFHERISSDKKPHQWQAVHLENEFVRLMLLPELGGRIHFGVDKTNGYDFFYHNEVIKPALVGLAGPWVAGGVEFNWPQHHRPATFLPTSSTIERESDGAVTVWCSDHDPFARMKGMHGVRLRPGSSVIELRVRLYNRGEQTETFLWWANVAARAGAEYQSFFPTDVRIVADHAKRAISAFPAADRPYYGIDYPARRGMDRQPGSDRTVPGDRIDWYRNIPVPTSYMCLGSSDDFFGGYDHGERAGFVHVADHSIATGKKQWTWGNSDFGHAWDRNLSDDRAPYVELMAGVYTDNQPDFSFLVPGETKAFSQFWYPIREIGTAQQANVDAALHLERISDDRMAVGVSAARVFNGALLQLVDRTGNIIWSAKANLSPARPFTADVPAGVDRVDRPELIVSHGGTEIIRWALDGEAPAAVNIEPASEPPGPKDVATVEELYLTGLHLRQYRHATRSPEPYWQEALLRDPLHSASHTALAELRYRAGQFQAAEKHLRAALRRLTELNGNPSDSAPYYVLGLVLERLGRIDEAQAAFAKAAWNRAWRAPSEFRRARIEARNGDNASALRRTDAVLSLEPGHLQARALRAILLRRLGRVLEAAQQTENTVALDPLDAWNRHLAGLGSPTDPQLCVDVALEYRAVGEATAALELLAAGHAGEEHLTLGQSAARPLVAYYAAELLDETGNHDEAVAQLELAASLDATWCFPGRLDDAELLRRRVIAAPLDGRAQLLLGHWLYAHGRRTEAITHWSAAAAQSPDVVAERNLGLAAFNVSSNPDAARQHYDAALAIAPDDARLLFEHDQLLSRLGVPPATRLARLEGSRASVDERDDLTIRYANLLVDVGRVDDAMRVMSVRPLQPCEGGEGHALAAWDRISLIVANRALERGDPAAAQAALRAAIDPPESLGEARYPLANDSALHLALGDALAAAGKKAQAREQWQHAATFVGDFRSMAVQAYSEMTFHSILAWRRLGESDRADELAAGLEAYLDQLRTTVPEVDYFATSLPDLLLFTDDLVSRRDQLVTVLSAQLAILRHDEESALSLLNALVDADPGHPVALDLIRTLDTLLSRSGKDLDHVTD